MAIRVIGNEEQVNRFSQGLKLQIRLKATKSGAQYMTEATIISLNVYAALFGEGMHNYHWMIESGPAPIESRNVEQREKERRQDACFTCYKHDDAPSTV